MVSQHSIIHISHKLLTCLPCIAQNGALRLLNLERIKWSCSTPLFLALRSSKPEEYKTALQNQTFVTGNKKEQCACTVLLYNRKVVQDHDVGKYLLFIQCRSAPTNTVILTVYKIGNLGAFYYIFIFIFADIIVVLQETRRECQRSSQQNVKNIYYSVVNFRCVSIAHKTISLIMFCFFFICMCQLCIQFQQNVTSRYRIGATYSLTNNKHVTSSGISSKPQIRYRTHMNFRLNCVV